ncbi:MAG TPA: cytochrome c, partial [Gemmata sp.]|nr:cytochrome c [Gemmata sp.]
MTGRGVAGVWIIAAVGSVLAGCGKSSQYPPGSAEALFEQNCARCHAQAGEPGGPPGIGSSKGPKLTKIGGVPGHDVEFFVRFITDPRSVRPNAKLMPAFGEELTQEEIRKLAEFLAAK